MKSFVFLELNCGELTDQGKLGSSAGQELPSPRKDSEVVYSLGAIH